MIGLADQLIDQRRRQLAAPDFLGPELMGPAAMLIISGGLLFRNA
jgi:hypothetical protein